MKKLLLTLLTVMCISPVFAGQFDEKGLISGWKFAPLQLGLGLKNHSKLVDEQSNVIFNIGLWEMDQQSAVFSIAGISALKYNYGISLGLNNWAHACYGIQIGFFNASDRFERSGDPGGFIPNGIHAQVVGINIADVIQIGLLNVDDNPGLLQMGLVNFCKGKSDFLQWGLLNLNGDKLKIGVVNLSARGFFNLGLVNFELENIGDNSFLNIGIFNHGGSTIQIGLLNYNPKSYIPWLPIVNWDMGREGKNE